MKRSPVKVQELRGHAINRNTRENATEKEDLQARHIQNLQQQIYFLEMEVSHLRAINDDSGRAQPALKAELEMMSSKLTESKKSTDQLRLELKKNETVIDILRADQFKLHQHMQESEDTHKIQKTGYLEELITLRKKCEYQTDTITELGASLKEAKTREDKSLGENTQLNTVTCDLQEQVAHLTKTVEKFKTEMDTLQGEILKKDTELQKCTSGEGHITNEYLKEEIQDLYVRLEKSEQTTEHERLLRSRVADDNKLLMSRHCDLETQLVDLRSQLKEVQAARSSLEKFHCSLVSELAETRSREIYFKTELTTLQDSLQQGRAKCASLSAELNSEQRRTAREQLNVARLESKMAELEERLSECRKESVSFQRETILLQNDVQQLKKETNQKQQEMEDLAQKVVDMQVNVKEFQINSEASNQLQGTRWRELMNLAEGLVNLSEKAASEHSYS